MSRATNYFKVHAAGTDRIFAFAMWDRGSIRAAFNLATIAAERSGTLSVFYQVPISGPWNDVAVIAPVEAALPVWRPLAKTVPQFAPFGEAGCF